MNAEHISCELLLNAYANGYFPMAESATSKEIHWFYPETRGILPITDFHVPKSLAKLARSQPFTITCDRAFTKVIEGCAERPETWINPQIIDLYTKLHRHGYAHSVECWDGSKLVGGVYGVALGGAFFGESMFSRVSGGSKIALLELVQRLREAGYRLLDAQYVNAHLKQFGICEISRKDYLKRLEKSLAITPKDAFI